MKKSIFLIVLFSFFTIPFSANALTFNVCDTDYQVSDFDTMRDYVYYTYIKTDNDYQNKSYYLSNYSDNNSFIFAYSDLNFKSYFNTINGVSSYTGDNSDVLKFNSSEVYSKIVNISIDSNSFKRVYRIDIKHDFSSSILTTLPIYTTNDYSTISIDSNWNFEDIENKYVCTSDEPVIPDESSPTFNISKEEFMLIPFLLSLLILMLFFKWCFPMKGGKKI